MTFGFGLILLQGSCLVPAVGQSPAAEPATANPPAEAAPATAAGADFKLNGPMIQGGLIVGQAPRGSAFS